MAPRLDTSATPFFNARSIRASIAVLVIIALGLAYVGFQRETERDKGRAMFLVSSLSWTVSELVLETLRLEIALRRHALGQATRDEVQLRFDVMWSRVDIVENSTLVGKEGFSTLFAHYRDFLETMEPILYDNELIAPRDALKGAAIASDLAARMRVAWMNSFAGRQQSTFREHIVAQPFTNWRETVIVGLLAVLLVYLLAEIFLGGRSHRRRMALLAEAKAAALANETKSRFLANVSHEIRTPLNGILGMASEMTSTPLNEDQRNCLDVIKHSGDVLLHTLNDVLDLSKVEAGQLSLESHEFDLRQVISTAAALYRPGAAAKGLTLTLDAHADGPSWVLGDSRRISQVLHNLLGNAVKFTDSGAITLSVGREPTSGFVRFSVIDTGPGIDPNVQSKVFEPFMQADGSVTREKGGTGLGLTISRSLCEAMGGDLNVESALGDGATFTFALPLPDVAQPMTKIGQEPISNVVPDNTQVSLARVLVVDDNATNRLLLRRFLRGMVDEVIEAVDGADAVARWRERSVDLILMDMQMPVMDGLEATDQIRAIERDTGQAATRIVAVTANVMNHQVAEYLARGVDDVLGKPVSKSALLDILGKSSSAAA